MATNRDYTGLQRTPSSLAWLIRRRAIAKGRLDKHLKDLEKLPAVIAQVRAEITNLDAVIPMHEVAVDPHQIAGKRPQRLPLAAHGVMSKSIWECLKLAGGRPVYTTEVAMHFIRRANLKMDVVGKPRIVVQIGSRLGGLCHKGRVVRHHSTEVSFNGEGLWSLPPDDTPEV